MNNDCDWLEYTEYIKIHNESFLKDKRKYFKENEFRIHLAFLIKKKNYISEHQIVLV